MVISDYRDFLEAEVSDAVQACPSDGRMRAVSAFWGWTVSRSKEK
jgi:hypothetical protein